MLASIALGLIVFLLAFPLARYVIFLDSNRRAGQLAGLRRRMGGLALPLCRGWLTAVAADLLVLPLYGLGALLGDGPERAGVPVVLVHGLYHNRTGWAVLARRLRRAGAANVHTYQYDSFLGTFDPAVEGLARLLDRLLGGRADARVILVGHSLGGLVCRAVAGDPRYRDRVAGLVALGSPHGGSELAWFGPNRMARDLIPGRLISRRVAEAADPDCPRLAVFSPVDDYVCPLPLLRPGRPGWREEICPPMGHVWMLFSPRVAASVLAFVLPLARRA
ncbi:alpha/beta fold hydrolase [Pseudodesulfovibrio sp.]|uniref:alpha/beta fold hydrolase n=1 Tax=Pseudodesulfovibrio sp. TaxID=2035812 RepID=UPI0026131629|nr:alpha/beta fold hydrolase [Pseudodesulfovibrio sp.]MDD3313067.1 alpha/beta fold hydrolase [Pseudodesulfovibrio sp.]